MSILRTRTVSTCRRSSRAGLPAGRAAGGQGREVVVVVGHPLDVILAADGQVAGDLGEVLLVAEQHAKLGVVDVGVVTLAVVARVVVAHLGVADARGREALRAGRLQPLEVLFGKLDL
jgi:hypothetical protein